jgi:hypothetical protein
LLDGPPGASFEHRVDDIPFQPNIARAAQTGRNVSIERIRQLHLHCFDILALEPSVEAAHTARDVEADAPSRNHAAFVRIECRDAADRESVAPVSVRHRIGRAHDPGQCRDVAHLLVDLFIHGANQCLVGVDHTRHAHIAAGLDSPA